VVYSGLTANQQLFPAVDFLRQSFGPKLYLVGSDYVYPRTTHALCRSYLKRVGGQVVGESYRPRGAVDFDPIVRAMERSGCDAILNTINGDSQKAFLQACRQAGLNRPMIHLSLSESQAAAMGDLCQDHYLAWGYFSSLSTPQSLRFQRAYQTAYGADRVVDDPCQTAYFQVLAFARAVSVAGSAEPTLLRRAMKSLILDTPGGLVRYDPRNLYCWRTVRIARVTQGRAKVVWSSELPIKPEPDPRF
jgi:urea transport system substrate-binding protein